MNNIIIDDKGKIRRYFTLSESSLVCREGDSSITLAEDCRDADCCTDGAGGTYAVAVCGSNIDCFQSNGGGWSRYTAVTATKNNCAISNIRAICISGRLNLWYCMECGGESLLIHQITDGEDMVGDPYIVGNLGYKKNYAVCCDYDKNPHIFYIDGDDSLCYMSYIWSEKKYTPVQQLGDRISYVSATANTRGNVYVAAVGKKAEFNVIYFKMLSEEDFRILGFGVDMCCRVDVVDTSKALYVQWMDNRECCECVSGDGGENFGRPVSVGGMRGEPNKTLAYRHYANPLGIGVNSCICNSVGRMLHEKGITENISEPVSLADELDDYCKRSAEGMQVTLDVATRLSALEKQVSEMAEYLQNMMSDDSKDEIGGVSDE